MENRFDIILVSHNRLDYLKRTIASLFISGALHDCERFIIVDNDSTEEGVQQFLQDLKKEYRVFLVLSPENKGWAAAVNNGLALSRAPYLLLLNNDLEVSFEFHKKMLEVFKEHYDIGILGVWKHTSHGLGKLQSNTFRETDDVPAVGWMLPKSAMEKVGMIEERGVCLTKGGNGEDSNYVQRMKLAGYLTGVTKEDVATHITGY